MAFFKSAEVLGSPISDSEKSEFNVKISEAEAQGADMSEVAKLRLAVEKAYKEPTSEQVRQQLKTEIDNLVNLARHSGN